MGLVQVRGGNIYEEIPCVLIQTSVVAVYNRRQREQNSVLVIDNRIPVYNENIYVVKRNFA